MNDLLHIRPKRPTIVMGLFRGEMPEHPQEGQDKDKENEFADAHGVSHFAAAGSGFVAGAAAGGIAPVGNGFTTVPGVLALIAVA